MATYETRKTKPVFIGNNGKNRASKQSLYWLARHRDSQTDLRTISLSLNQKLQLKTEIIQTFGEFVWQLNFTNLSQNEHFLRLESQANFPLKPMGLNETATLAQPLSRFTN